MALGDLKRSVAYEDLVIGMETTKSRRQYRPKAPLSVLTIILFVLGIQFVVLPRYVYQLSPSQVKLSNHHLEQLEIGLQKCAAYTTLPVQYPVTRAGSRSNPRWNPTTGQNETVVLKNATLFDGETILSGAIDIVFKKGIIESVSVVGESSYGADVKVIELGGQYVTPGLVDLHSHHLAFAWPLQTSTDDTNEVSMGPTTSQVRIIDSLKAYDIATTIIASGGITTSLILPGSANIMGGEAVLVKNLLRSGENSEEIVEEILLEHGIPKESRRRFMKMACGENPRRVYHHTRMGNAWLFRQHMERAKELMEKQNSWCLEAAAVRDSGDASAISRFSQKSDNDGATDYLEYDSAIAMLRGQVGINVHCYETEDFDDMLSHSKEFGFRIQAFHHALSAWKVPELIKASGQNITIATFAEFGLYKKEAYEANLYAGKILAEHGVPVAYKSDHVNAETNAKYLLFQAATAHSFQLPEDLALQSVTSVPAKSLEIDHRVGYVRPGYDADIVVWNSHPLSVGATALQVYIDGRATLDPKVVTESGAALNIQSAMQSPLIHKALAPEAKEKLCSELEKSGVRITVTGIQESYLESASSSASKGDLTMVVDNGKIVCLDLAGQCATFAENSLKINLENGYVLPGLTAVSVSLGLSEIAMDSSTGDGSVSKSSSSIDPENVVYAKYGVHLDGKGFARAKIGGITTAITPPTSSGFATGVSVAIKTSGKKSLLNGGVFKEDVALHFLVGQTGKSDSLPTISSEIHKLRQILSDNKEKDNVYGKAANGTLPLVVNVENEYDIAQLIKLKQDYPEINLVIFGGSGAPLVAEDLAKAKIPVILTANRGAPDSWEKINALPGPPLSKSPAAVLSSAGVKFGLAIPGESDSHIHNIPIEASWAAKYAGLSSKQAIDLVSINIEEILGLTVEKAERDFVVFEGNPLEFGASVVFAFDGKDGVVSTCWPEAT